MASRKQVKTKKSISPKANSKPRVLVLGITGMLGSMVFRYLNEQGFIVAGTVRDKKVFSKKNITNVFEFNADEEVVSDQVFKKWKPDYVINCIGIIKPYCKDDDPVGVVRAVRVNALFPHLLADFGELYGFRTIQIATDCVYSGTKGGYTENDPHDALDVYGKTKSLGEVRRGKFLNIRTSIIGPEEKGKLSLLEWYLAQPEGSTIKGFAHHHWNGVTVLQFAQLVSDIVNKGKDFFDSLVSVSPVHHLVVNESVNKYELMEIFCSVFPRQLVVERVDSIGPSVDRTLGTKFSIISLQNRTSMKEAILALATYMRERKIGQYA